MLIIMFFFYTVLSCLIIDFDIFHTGINDPDDKRNWLNEQQTRRKTIKYVCDRHPSQSGNLTTDLLKHVLVSDKYKVLYCFVPKVACTTWKRIILLLNNKHVTKVHQTSIPSLFGFSKEGVKRRLKEYTKILIVRNPHERLLSAYNEKFKKRNRFTVPTQKRFAPLIRNHNLNVLQEKFNLSTSERYEVLKKAKNTDVSFQEFIRYVGDVSNSLSSAGEAHWREMHRLCSPCDIHYDFIGKLETMADDGKHILSHIGADNLLHILSTKPHATNSSSENKVQAAFRQVTEEDVVRFEKRFKMDMELFGYQRPTGIIQLKSEDEDRRDALSLWANFFLTYTIRS